MKEWITVNGATIEKVFFDENVAEARSCTWMLSHTSELRAHVHCLICGLAIAPDQKATNRVYSGARGWLCEYCYNSFVAVT